MVMDYRQKLSFFFRTVRRAQKKSQKDITSELGISQAALAKFETNKAAALSLKKLSEIAPKLNINPDYVVNGFGNPFKQEPDSIIKMFFTEDSLSNINLYLIDLIIANNARTLLLFLKPRMLADTDRMLLKKRGERHSYCLIIKDSDDNLFLFRRENKDEFFDEIELVRRIESTPEVHFEIIGPELFSKIRGKWSEVNFNDIRRVLESTIRREDLFFLRRLINKVRSDSSQSDQEEYTEILKKLGTLDKADIRLLFDRLLPEIGSILKKSLKSISKLNPRSS